MFVIIATDNARTTNSIKKDIAGIARYIIRDTGKQTELAVIPNIALFSNLRPRKTNKEVSGEKYRNITNTPIKRISM